MSAIDPLSAQSDSDEAQDTAREYRIKAAFLFNFAKHTVWPASAFKRAAAPLHFCVLGDDPFRGQLDSIAGKQVGGREIIVRILDHARQSDSCHMIFYSDSETNGLSDYLDMVAGNPVLTVSDIPTFAASGGMIALSIVDNRIRIGINDRAARAAGLRMSDQLLALAEATQTRVEADTGD